MAVFVSGSDESSGKHQRDHFFFAGFVGPEIDWSSFFVPAWCERVLNGPPAIPYLHMTEMRSRKWRANHGMSRLDAEDRIDEAIALLSAMGSFYPMCIYIHAGDLRDAFKTQGASKLKPDYICFLQYVFVVLMYLNKYAPDVEKVDFVAERKLGITNHIKEFHSQIADTLRALGYEALAELVGELIPGGKERVPLQAADILCWHLARKQQSECDQVDRRRLQKLVERKKGQLLPITKERIWELRDALSR